MNRKQRRAAAKLRGTQLAQPTRVGALGSTEDIYTALAQSHNDLGHSLHSAGESAKAEASFRRALALQPEFTSAHYNLGVALQALGKPAEAEASYRRALVLQPEFTWAHHNLGIALQVLGRAAQAEGCYRRALVLEPELTEAHSSLGNVLLASGKLAEAEISYRRALALKPNNAGAQYNLGIALHEQGKLSHGEAHYREALAMRPDYTDAYTNLGNALIPMGRLDDAIACYERALAIEPDLPKAQGNLLLCLNYLVGTSTHGMYLEARRWNERVAARCGLGDVTYENERTSSQRLRVGYVSPDFRSHSVAYFLEPLLRAHNRSVVEIFCYAEVAQPDAATHRLRALADHWVMTVGMSDDALADRIRQDKIDILVDLAGHTRGNRLLVFARKPAPVQVTWLGYPNTTGLSTMDYRLVDALTDPPDETPWASERLVRIEGGFVCYGPPAEAPEPAPPPSIVSGAVTFGSFNNLAKLSALTLDVWATLMHRVAGSRLLLKSPAFRDGSAQALFQARLSERGIGSERVILLGPQRGSAEHLACYHQVDIALDPFPYNGTTTTCEALWMGVPVVTLRGDRHAGRVGASLLARVNLDELIAGDVDDYVEIAARLAADQSRLANFHGSLRPRMQSSPLCDAVGFARKFEAIYRLIWRRWCEADRINLPSIEG